MISGTCFPATGAATGAPFVLIPGLGLSNWYLRRLASALSRSSVVWIVDIGGAPRTVEEMGGALSDWMKARGVVAACVAGHSFGAQVATALAVSSPELVRNLILISPAVDPAGKSVWRHALRMLREIPHEPPGLICYAAWRSLCHPLRSRRDAKAARRFVIENALPRVKARTLVLNGSSDRVIPVAWATRVAGLLPHGRLEVLPDQGHGIAYTAWREVADAVLKFCSGRDEPARDKG